MILITEFMDEVAIKRLMGEYETLYQPELVDNQENIPVLIKNARVLIVRNRTQVTSELLAAAPGLSCVGRLGVGLDNIDQEACAISDVTIYSATGANNLCVAEYVITSAMVLARNAYMAKDQMLAGEWPRQLCCGREIAGKTLGLVGFGAIAQHTATLARALGMQIVAYDPYLDQADRAWDNGSKLELDELLAKADIVSLHTPLTPDTRHLINGERLALMKPDAILINAARGAVVDENALALVLKEGKLGGAALDVFEEEPLSLFSAARFADINNILLTPHIAGVSIESNQRVSALIADRVLQHLKSAK